MGLRCRLGFHRWARKSVDYTDYSSAPFLERGTFIDQCTRCGKKRS